MPEKITLPCRDGYQLQATFYPAKGTHGLIINSAMGVSQRFYRAFAEHMSSTGVSVLTYDYRGMERHDDSPIDVDILHWGQDQSDVVSYMHNQQNINHITLLGNSVGGQIIGLIDQPQLINKAVLITSQIGDWRLWPMPTQLKVWFLWYAAIPLLTLGQRFPAHWLGLGKTHWPSQVAKMWADWGRQKDYLFNPKFNLDLSGWHNLSLPLYSVGISDDDLAPEVAIQGLLAQFKSADINHNIIKPEDLGLKRIGHFGYFNAHAKPLWDTLIQWIKNDG